MKTLFLLPGFSSGAVSPASRSGMETAEQLTVEEKETLGTEMLEQELEMEMDVEVELDEELVVDVELEPELEVDDELGEHLS